MALVSRGELSALGDRAAVPICIRVPPKKTPPEPLIRYLQSVGVPVSHQKDCYPRGEYPRGVEINISDLRRSNVSQLDLTVDTADITLGRDVHFATPLREGTYHLKQDDKGEWTIIGYTKKK